MRQELYALYQTMKLPMTLSDPDHAKLFMAALWNRADHIYFHDVVCSFFLLFFLA